MSQASREKKRKEPGGDAMDPTDPPPFFTSATITTKHRKALIGCSIKPSWKKTEEDRNKDQLAAAVGNEFVYVYRLPVDGNRIELLNTITFKFMVDPTMKKDNDELYRVAWVCDEIDSYSSKIVTAGKKGLIYVVDVVDNKMERVLEGNKGAINDIRTHPTNPGMFATASTDLTVRVWHIRAKHCLVIFNNPAAHVSKILTVDWSPDGRSLFSAGFDHRIICWNLAEENVRSHLKKCYKSIKAGRSIDNIKDELNMDPKLRLAERIFDPRGHTLIVKTVNNLANEIHFDTVDSLRVIGYNDVNYIVSKSTGKTSQLKFWRFGTWGDVVEKKLDGPLRAVTHLDKKNLPMSEEWFTKMDVDASREWVATVGEGVVVFFNLKSLNDEYVARIGTSQLRQVVFSENGRILLAVGDGGVVARFDRNDEFIQNNLLQSLSLADNDVTDSNVPSTSESSVSRARRRQFYREVVIDDEDMNMSSTSGTAHRRQPSPSSSVDYELDYSRPSTSGTYGPPSMDTVPARSLRKASRRRRQSSECSTEESETRVKSRRACTPSMRANKEESYPADENVTVGRAPVKPSSNAFSGPRTRIPMSPRRQKSIANAKASSQNAHEGGRYVQLWNRGDLSNSDREQLHQDRSGIEEDQEDEEEVGRRRSEATGTEQPIDGDAASSTGQQTNANISNGTSSNQVTLSRGRSRGRPPRIRFGWQRSAPHNTRPSISGQPSSQQPRRGVGRPRGSVRRVQVPRSSPTEQTTTNLSESSSTAIRGSTRGPGRPRKVQVGSSAQPNSSTTTTD
ncbi:hypothetical protein B9Z55_025983 [Caenorhabditis nigoni]|uniref:Uncharacterized protein n=1 Tax=Caenorhabditis nigoni TaxID=1611254 RepID=A0A2G5T198_9PELO|nr:hypothetical protein B9Z55_025983 [Caenorhabditis nigoni]